MPDANEQITIALHACRANNAATGELIGLVYDQLRAIAQARMNQERAGHTLQATALVHEACFRLLGDSSPQWEDRGHFFRAAAEAMRRILIDHARMKKSAKRGGGGSRVPLSVVDLAVEHDPEQVLELDEALRKLEAEDPSAGEVVQLRFFGGLSVQEVAQVMGISERTVAREWAFARARLFELLGADGVEQP
ncbi:MAG: sigma-70 family RNA polymerase sigma factor [Phycisphaeraceae bacterium]|nr:sigma-70 family RNA polymerase sigma factor [Phycisphaeraceae bacterium]